MPGSFRDPAGFVFRRGDRVFRQINRAGREDLARLVDSGLYEDLAGAGLLIPHRAADVEPAEPESADSVIEPEPIGFIAYPYEWCFGQLKAAALLTLEIERRAVARGLSLKDASAYNVQFRGHRPVFVDTLSFEAYEPGRPWAAYRQFCQHFLAPLALMAKVDIRLGELLRSRIDGIPLDLAAKLLPVGARLRPSLLIHLVLHAGLQGKASARPAGPPAKSATFGESAMLGLVENLKGAVESLRFDPGRKGWAAYEKEHTYTPESWEHKANFVASAVAASKPSTCWDLGANTGRFSRVVSGLGVPTWSFDFDPACVEWSYRESVRLDEANLVPLRMDLADPSPGGGWAHRERSSLLDRGPAGLVLALAVVHHLAIANNVPLPSIAGFLARAGRWAVVEFVPKSDPQARRLLSAREDIFVDYDEEGFRRALEPHFRVHRREAVAVEGGERSLYLLERKGD
ncbi:MAG: SAM-dependent methyltransferase [Isosphaeraceae bacterium]